MNARTKKVLITGVYGLIGSIVYDRLIGCGYDVYGLARRQVASDRVPEERVQRLPPDHLTLADVTDMEAVQRAVEGKDVVIHMAADADGLSSWETIMPSNVVGTYHVLEAARRAGARRVILASSIQVVFGYQDTEPYQALFEARYGDVRGTILPVTHRDPPRPPNLYAASKVWGEALAHVYAQQYGISCLCLRIGWVVADDVPPNRVAITQWCSQRDIAQLVERCVAAPDDLRFDIFYGISDNPYRWVDLEHARAVLGYVPEDRAPGPA
ncbi:MAG: NAD-dependent epimerase/dehydratase family protein [Anaerolineae bacterium]